MRSAGQLSNRLSRAALVALLATLTLFLSPAAAARCGAVNQVPCKVWERIPSCDKGLVEDFAKNRCVRPAKPKPLACGKEGQRPCLLTERIPSCDANLVEDFAKNHCVRPDCGRKGGTPCKVWVRIPSCDQGLVEDFVNNRCVPFDAKVATCIGLLTAMHAGQAIPGLDALLPKARERQQPALQRLRNDPAFKDALMQKIAAAVAPFQAQVPEMKRISAFLNNARNQAALDAIFSPQDFCRDSIATMDLKLAQLGLVPDFARGRVRRAAYSRSEHDVLAQQGSFFMGYQATFGASAGLGAQVGVIGITDFRGNGGKYWFIGPALVSNLAAGIVAEVIFFPQVTLTDFKGWGFGVGVTAGPPTKIVAGALDVMMDEKLTTVQGFGVGGGLGLGAIPADIGVSATHSWQY
jgi:hypothetical protein